MHLRLFILLKDEPGWAHNKGSPLGQVFGDAVHFFGCASNPYLDLKILECSRIFPSFKQIHAVPFKAMKLSIEAF